MDFEFQEELKRIEAISDVLYREHFQLSDIGISSKTAHDWTKAGIYLRERQSKFRRKYNGLEYIWLKLVMELREFGLPISAIVKLREFLLHEIDNKEFYSSLFEDGEQVDTGDGFIKTFVDTLSNEREADKDIVLLEDGKQILLMNTMLSVLVSSTIICRNNVHLAINKNGGCIVQDDNPSKDFLVSDMIIGEPYISFPLNHILKHFVWVGDLYVLKNEQERMSDDERKILELIREGGISSLHIKFKDGAVSLMETEEIIDVNKAQGKLSDLMLRGSYQEISYKTENGKVVSVKRKTKHK